MRQIHRHAGLVVIGVLLCSTGAQAQFVNSDNRSYGMYLPTPVAPQGHDEVRAADGTTCRSSIAGTGPTIDVGGIGAENGSGRRMNGTIYGRVVFQLGRQRDRINCKALYQLELERLRSELRQAKAALTGSRVSAVSNEDFASGWTEGTD